MNILFVNRSDAYEVLGGDTIQMVETKNALEKLGLKVDVSLGKKDVSFYKDYDIIHCFNVQTDKFVFKEVEKIKKAKKCLVISPIWWDFEQDMSDEYSSYNWKVKLVYNIFGEKTVKFIKRKKLEKRYDRIKKILNIANFILPNSKMEIASLKRCFSFDENKIYVVYNGVDNSFIDQSIEKTEKERQYALQVGRIEYTKNTLLTIKACKELGIPLKIIGKKIDEVYYNRCILESKGANVIFMKPKEHLELIKIYKNAKLHVLPSFRETPGLVSLEAGVLGCNIVTTEIGSTREYFGKYGYYCDPKDYNSIKNSIEKAWIETSNYKLRNHIISNFTWDIAAVQTLEVYNITLDNISEDI
ncbi:MAG: glycosyltransferase [Clostridiaceae bacterium]